MKAKKIAVFVTGLLISFMVINFDAFAQFNDVDSSPFISSINKMHDLEILKGVGNNSFKPDGSVTREQFATIIIKVLDLEESANLNKSKSVFSDVEVGRWSIGFINEAYHKNLITGKTDGLFYPEEDINYGQLCTMMVKALGYNDTDVTGVWPYNYVNKARDLEIIKNLNIDPFECVKREEIAYILDKSLDTKVKNSNMTFAQKLDMYIEDIIISNSITNDNIKDNQVGTIGNGILDKKDTTVVIDIGEKYDLVLKDGVIKKAIKLGNKVEKLTVIDYKEGILNYYEGDEEKSLILSEKNNYYNDGVKVRFEDLDNIIKRNSVLVLLYDINNDIVVENVTIIDAIHSEPQVVNNNIKMNGMLNNYDLKALPILKEGKYIKIKDIENKDVVYEITSYFGEHSYYEVISNTVQGELTDILPNKLAPSHIEIEKKSYPISKYMDMAKITDAINGYKVGDKVCAVLGYDGKVVDLMDKDVKTGKYQKLRILGNSKSIESFEQNQILTDAGTYYVMNGLEDLELGAKYELLIDDDTIVKVGEKTKNQFAISVKNIDGQKVTYGENEKSMLLHTTAKYYHNGQVTTYSKILGVLDYNTTIIFVYNENKTGYEFAIVIDPIRDIPQVVNNNINARGEIGNYDLKKLPILKEGKYINIKEIENKDVIYKVTNYYGENSYYEVISSAVQGELTDILPNKLAPSYLEIEKKSYPISKYMNIKKITDAKNGYKVGDKVCAILGYDGKVVDLMDKDVKTGKYQKLRILGNSRCIDTFKDNQVLTENGIYYVLNDVEELELGAKYEVLIDDDTIVKVGEKTKNQVEISVRNVDGQKITYGKNGDIMQLPTTAKYYYKGSLKSYQEIIGILQYNTSIIFVYNENKTGYEFAIVIDPIYSEPKIVKGYNPYQKYEYGGFKYNRDIPVIIDGKTTDIYDINNDTVMYLISDYWDNNKYLLILDTKVFGKIKEFMPTRLNVNSIKIDFSNGIEKTYTFSEYFNINKITENTKTNTYTEGTYISVYLDKDGKILSIE